MKPSVFKKKTVIYCSRACRFPNNPVKHSFCINRFLKKVTKTESCWLWNAEKNQKGYGRVYFEHKRFLAHRISYSFFKGEISNGLLVLHKCDVPSCVNPDHLFLGTNQDNTDDCMAKGRNKNRKSFFDKLQIIKDLKNLLDNKFIIEKHGISPTYLYKLKSIAGKYCHLTKKWVFQDSC